MSISKIAVQKMQLRQFEGPLTERLVRAPSQFGLGQVPAELNPHSTTSLVCGYCSTGCSLKAHLKDGEAVNLSTDSSYPVNLGMACPNISTVLLYWEMVSKSFSRLNPVIA